MSAPPSISALAASVEADWPSIQSTLEAFIRIPNQSPQFDPDHLTNGHCEAVITLFSDWVAAQAVPGLTLEVMRAPGRTPLMFLEVSATGGASGTVLLYGHLDCQPPMTEAWSAGLHPHVPVVRAAPGVPGAPLVLYGRGASDDGYALFGAVAALRALKAQGTPHGRAVIVIEASEESGSPDLPHYILSLRERIGVPTLIVCLDSGAGDYERMWCTTSLRGLVGGTLRTAILREAVHSGSSSGVVPSSFRLTRQLLSRIEDEATGRVLLPELHCPIPPARLAQAAATAALLGSSIITNFPFVAGAGPQAPEDLGELLLRRTWRPALSITGAGGLPPLDKAGNVLRTDTALKLSMRLPPRCAAEAAGVALKAALEAAPPCGAHVRFELEKSGSGWDAPQSAPWLEAAIEAASLGAFGKPPAYMGEGGSIPFMGMLGELFPKAQFVVTGVLGPASNAHGPDEFLHIDFTKRIITAVSFILAAHGQQQAGEDAGVAGPTAHHEGGKCCN